MATYFPQPRSPADAPGALPVLRLFGELSLSVGLRRVEIPRGCRRLVAFMALRHRRLERPYVAGSLWPVNDEARANGNLRSALWRLNRLDVPLVAADRHGLTLRDEVVIDLHEAGEWATRVIDGVAAPAELRALPPRVDALELLPGWYDDWALVERERVRQRLLHAIEAQCRQLTCLGLHADAVDAAMVAVCADPLRESAQRVLLEAHLAAGDRAEARRGLALYTTLLHRELGTTPAPELTGLLAPAPDAG